jgi:glycosyltransferase involved in cell wall biosynthesis
MRPVLFVTGEVRAYRVGALTALHEREEIEVVLSGGRGRHAGPDAEPELPFRHRRAAPGAIARLAAGGGYRAVVCSTAGRLAPLAAWGGARAGRVPLLLWASLWAHPRSAAHAVSYLPLRRLYRSADAVVTYGPHVSAYVRARGARNVHVAPQAVDNAFWGGGPVHAPADPRWPHDAAIRFLFAGGNAPGKGLDVLLRAWELASPPRAALVLAGPTPAAATATGAEASATLTMGTLAPEALRDVYAACEVLVVPSVGTATWREPWGLVVNEAMNRGLAVIASDAVGAAAGGLVRDGETGVVVPAGDARALAGAISRLARDGGERAGLGAAGRTAVAGHSFDAWAEGFSRALSTVGASRELSTRAATRVRW